MTVKKPSAGKAAAARANLAKARAAKAKKAAKTIRHTSTAKSRRVNLR